MSEFRLRFATDELERAQRDVEQALLSWKFERASSPTECPIDEMEALCVAVDFLYSAERDFKRAQIEAQAEWVAAQRTQGDGPVAGRSPSGFEAPHVPSPARRLEFSRED